MAKRVSLVERQQRLLEERGFSKPSKLTFAERQDAAAVRQGRANATAGSRRAVETPLVAEPDDGADGAASVATRFSNAPSLHPSLAGSCVSAACSEVTIGAGDETGYWDYQHRLSTRADLGHRCRECKRPFERVGEPLTERRGARVSMRYHAECFSGFADPRSQASSSHHVGRLAGLQLAAAPGNKVPSPNAAHAAHSSGGLRPPAVGSREAARSP